MHKIYYFQYKYKQFISVKNRRNSKEKDSYLINHEKFILKNTCMSFVSL